MELVRVIRSISQGPVWASRPIIAEYIDRCADSASRRIFPDNLTDREREILSMLVAGIYGDHFVRLQMQPGSKRRSFSWIEIA